MSTTDDALARILPETLSRYLRVHHWVGEQRSRSTVFRRETKLGEAEVEIPASATYRDYPRRLREVFDVLTAVEGIAEDELLTTLRYPSADIVQLRLSGDAVIGGTLGLSDSARIRTAQRQLLLAAAHSADAPDAHFARMTRTEPLNFLSECRELPSQAGSYVSRIVVPVTPRIGQLDIDEPFARRATTMLARALATTREAVATGDDQRLLYSAHEGVSANLLDALALLHPPGETGALTTEFRWSAFRPQSADVRSSSSFPRESFQMLSEAARVVRDQTPSYGYEVRGYVASLRREPPDDIGADGTVVIATTFEGSSGQAKVHVTVESESYQRALEAHRDGSEVSINGTLVKDGRRWTLRTPTELNVFAEGKG